MNKPPPGMLDFIQLPRKYGSASQAINAHDCSLGIKERQAREHISSDFPPGGVDMFSHQLNKLPSNHYRGYNFA